MTNGQKPRFLDRNHPFFAKPWVRALTVAVTAAMSVLDFSLGNPGWGLLFAAGAVWALWELFLKR